MPTDDTVCPKCAWSADECICVHPRTNAAAEYLTELEQVRNLVSQLGPAMADPERAIELIDRCGQRLQVMVGCARVMGRGTER